MVLVLNAKVKTLVLAIKGNVVVDSEIYIYYFKSYAILIAEGYLLRIVNHNVDFVVLDDMKKKESNWRPAKNWMR